MRVKPNLLHKIPNRVMPVGNHIVGADLVEYEIDADDIKHLESVGTQHWVEIQSVEKPKKKAGKKVSEKAD